MRRCVLICPGVWQCLADEFVALLERAPRAVHAWEAYGDMIAFFCGAHGLGFRAAFLPPAFLLRGQHRARAAAALFDGYWTASATCCCFWHAYHALFLRRPCDFLHAYPDGDVVFTLGSR